MKKAIVKISEGLGNQLFMYAHAYAFSKKMGYNLFIDSISAYKKLKIRSFLLDNMMIDLKKADPADIPNNFAQYLKFKLNKKVDFIRSKKKFLIERKFKNKATKYIDYTNKTYSDKVYIEGFFESEKYFLEYKNDIINQFQLKNISRNSLFVDPNTIKNENSVSIAIRQHRFSEKNNTLVNRNKSDLFVKDTISYIHKACELFKSKIKDPKFYIFSNDVSNLENIFDKKIYKIVNHKTNKPLNDFYLSTLCKYFIVGPTTFHWWSAYLSTNLDKICIRPNNKIKFSSNENIYPEKWIKI